MRKQLKIKLNKADLTCFKNKNKCWSLTESPTLNEDLFPADNSDSAYDIVRNSDFMVSVNTALEWFIKAKLRQPFIFSILKIVD